MSEPRVVTDRDAFRRAAAAEGERVSVETGRYESTDLHAADEAFLTNTTWEVRPVASVASEAVGHERAPRPVTGDLARCFDALVEERHY